MAFVFPLSTAAFMDTLGIEKVIWDVERYDEYDSQGTGHDMQSELAPPKWTAALTMRDLYNADARAMAAKVRKLFGSQNAVMIYDPSNPYPANDPGGAIIAGSAVQVNVIGVNNQSLSLKGLPPNYKLTAGDKGQISFGPGGSRNFFFEFSEDVTASGGGITIASEIYPHIPIGIAVDATVILSKPACKMIVKPKGFSPGQSSGNMTFGGSLNMLEKV